jgi:hypothetical protein
MQAYELTIALAALPYIIFAIIAGTAVRRKHKVVKP